MSSRFLVPHDRVPDSHRIQVFAAFVDQRFRVCRFKPRNKAIAEQPAGRVSAVRIESETDHRPALTHHIRDQRKGTNGHLAEINIGVANFRFNRYYHLADVYDPHHAAFLTKTYFVQARCSKGRSSRISFTCSRFSTLSMRFAHCVVPRIGAIRSRALATISSVLMGFLGVPRTLSTRCVRCVPSVNCTSTIATRKGIKRSNWSSGINFTLSRSRSVAGSFMRPLSCAELNVTVLSIYITAAMCCREMSGISRLFTMAASSVASRTETCRTSLE